MYFYIRLFLSKIREFDNKLNEKQKIFIVSTFVLSSVVGIIVDIYLSNALIFKVIRMSLAVYMGILIFSFIYLHLLKREKKDDYVPLREKFSYQQRINIGIVLFGGWFIALILTSNPSALFTFTSSLLVSALLGIVAFVRSSRVDEAQASMGLSDPRDTHFIKAREEELERRKNKKG